MKKIDVKPKGGFTLLELMIVSALMAVVVLAIHSAYRQGIRLWTRLQYAGIDKEKVILVVGRISKELKNTFNYTEDKIRFAGTKESISFPALIKEMDTSAGTSEPYVISKPGRISYSLDEDEEVLYRQQFKYSEAFQDKKDITRRKMLGRVTSLTFSYYQYNEEDKEYRWQEEWDEEDMLPYAVRIEIKLKGESDDKEETVIRTISIPAAGQG